MSSVLKGSLACVVCSAEALPTPSVRDRATARAMRFNFYLPVQGFPAATGKAHALIFFSAGEQRSTDNHLPDQKVGLRCISGDNLLAERCASRCLIRCLMHGFLSTGKVRAQPGSGNDR
jgi:hypothetical protein